MANESMENWKEAIDFAAKAADVAPEKYQEAAFREALRFQLFESGDTLEIRAKKRKAPTSKKPQRDPDDPAFQPWERELIDDLPDAATAAQGGRSQQTVWAVVRLLEDSRDADVEAVPSTIKTKLGKAPQSDTNTSRTLKKLVPKYLSRSEPQEGQAYLYRPTRDALQIFGD